MTIFGLYITTAKIAKRKSLQYEAIVKKNAKDNSFWNKITSRLLRENHNLRIARG